VGKGVRFALGHASVLLVDGGELLICSGFSNPAEPVPHPSEPLNRSEFHDMMPA
jgi:hypothetical protein